MRYLSIYGGVKSTEPKKLKYICLNETEVISRLLHSGATGRGVEVARRTSRAAKSRSRVSSSRGSSSRGSSNRGSSRRGSSSLCSLGLLHLLLGVGGRQALAGHAAGGASNASRRGRGGRRRRGRSERGCHSRGSGDRAAGSLLDNGPPLLRVVGGVGLEAKLGVRVEGVSDFAAGNVLALHVELDAVNGADDAFRQVQRKLRGRVAAEIVVVLELVQIARRGDDVVACAVALDEGARATLERAFDERLCGAVLHVREGDAGEGARGRVWVDQDCVVAHAEVHPFKVRWDALRGAEDVGVHGALALELPVHVQVELLHGALHGLQDVCFELLEGVLHGEDILAVVVLLVYLVVQTVVDAALEEVRVIVRLDLAAGGGVEAGGVLT